MGVKTGVLRYSAEVRALRDVLEGVPQLNAQVLDVAPLAFLHWLACQLDVVHCQLGLVEQPLDHKHGALIGDSDKVTIRTFLCTGLTDQGNIWVVVLLKAVWLTSYGGENSISKETVPLLPFVDLPAPLRYHPSPVPDGKGRNISNMIAVRLCENLISSLSFHT